MSTALYETPLYNEVTQEQGLVAIETNPGFYQDPAFRMPLGLTVTSTTATQENFTATGGYDQQTAYSRGGLDVVGTLGGDAARGSLAFEDMPFLDRIGLGGIVSGGGVSDAGSPASYLYTARPSKTDNDLATFSAEVMSRHQVRLAEMLMLDQETITVDPGSNSSWVYSGSLLGRGLTDKPVKLGIATSAPTTTTLTDTAAALTPGAWVGGIIQVRDGDNTFRERIITANTATVITFSPPITPAPANSAVYVLIPDFKPGVVNYARELIPAAGTEVYLDNRGGTIGTTLVEERFRSLSITTQNNQRTKRFGENIDKVSRRRGRGRRRVTVQLTMEADRKRMVEEMTEFQRADRREQDVNWRRLRVRGLGSEIRAGVRRQCDIDIARLHWDSFTWGDANGNRIGTLSGTAYVDDTALAILERRTRCSLAAIPA